jgi:dTDP-glucose 4,6-dehydratase
MRIVVTGGLGFIGSSFVNLVKEKNPTATVLVVDKCTYAANPNNISKSVEYLKEDICNVTAEDLGDYDYIVHFAAESHVDNSIKDGKPFIRTNVEGTFNLLELTRQNKTLKKFIHISTDEVYGDKLNGESKETDKIFGSSYYSATKASSDLLVLAAHRTFGLPYIITRTCNNYGSHQHKEKFLPTIIRSIKESKEVPVYGDGQQIREWIDVNDNVEQIYNLMLSDEVNEIFNIGTGERYTNVKLLEKVADELGTSVKYRFVEDRLGHDRRYALDSTKLKECGFDKKYKTLTDFLKEEVKKLK